MAVKIIKRILCKLAFTIKASFLVLQVMAQNPHFGLYYEQQKATKLWVLMSESISGNENHLNVLIQGKSTALLLEHELHSDTIWLSPLFPFNPNLVYELHVSKQLVGTFQPKRPIAAASQLTIYPRAAQLPVNLLKMQLVFSSPMQVGNAYHYISVANDTGIVQPFLELQPELWNEDKTILTLWLDPGRIKRDLIRSNILGAPLAERQEYLVQVAKKWPTQNGQTLDKTYHHVFYTLPAARKKLEPSTWKTSFPPIASQQALSINFGQSMDYLLLHHSIQVYHNGQQVMGTIHTLDNERVWQFIPNKNWQAGSYQLVIENRLEDLAGNNLNHAFDREIDRQQAKEGTTHVIDFKLKE